MTGTPFDIAYWSGWGAFVGGIILTDGILAPIGAGFLYGGIVYFLFRGLELIKKKRTKLIHLTRKEHDQFVEIGKRVSEINEEVAEVCNKIAKRAGVKATINARYKYSEGER